MPNIQQVQTYQVKLQQYLQNQKSSLTQFPNELETSLSFSNQTKSIQFIWLILGGLLGTIVLVGF